MLRNNVGSVSTVWLLAVLIGLRFVTDYRDGEGRWLLFRVIETFTGKSLENYMYVCNLLNILYMYYPAVLKKHIFNVLVPCQSFYFGKEDCSVDILYISIFSGK